jgi:3-isopropylmalate/(R)-2-methylmalate dehydratase small subunit
VLEVASTFTFQIPPLQREMLLRGLDAVDFTLTFETDIDAFQARDRVARPWVYLSAI